MTEHRGDRGDDPDAWLGLSGLGLSGRHGGDGPSGGGWFRDCRNAAIVLTGWPLGRRGEIGRAAAADSRRAFVEKLEKRFAEEGGGDGPAALFYVDLDNFKQVNDTHGHQRGDEALLEVASLLREESRAGDLAARLGGDEFALFMIDMDEASAGRKGAKLLKLAERLRGFSGDADHLLGFSLGIAIHEPRKGETLQSLMGRADEAMYGAKRAGKHSLNIASAYERRKAGA